MITFQAFNFTAQLALEQVCYYRVVPGCEVLAPLRALLFYWKGVAIDFFVLWLLFDSVQFVVHAFEKEPEEFLGVLLTVAAELASDAADLLFQLTRSNGTTSAHPGAFQESVIGIRETSSSERLLRRKVRQEVLGQRCSSKNALQNRIHKTRVANVVQAGGAVAVALGYDLRDRLLGHWELINARTAPKDSLLLQRTMLGRFQWWHQFCAGWLRRLLLFESLPDSRAFGVLVLAVAFPEQGRMVSRLLHLISIRFLELSGVPIVIAKRILLKVLRSDLCPCSRGALVLLQLVLPPIYRCPTILSPADDSFTFAAHNLASRLCPKINMKVSNWSIIKLNSKWIEGHCKTMAKEVVHLHQTSCCSWRFRMLRSCCLPSFACSTMGPVGVRCRAGCLFEMKRGWVDWVYSCTDAYLCFWGIGRGCWMTGRSCRRSGRWRNRRRGWTYRDPFGYCSVQRRSWAYSLLCSRLVWWTCSGHDHICSSSGLQRQLHLNPWS